MCAVMVSLQLQGLDHFASTMGVGAFLVFGCVPQGANASLPSAPVSRFVGSHSPWRYGRTLSSA